MKKSTWKTKIILMLLAFFVLMNVNIKYVQATNDFITGANKFLQAKENLEVNSISSQAEIDPEEMKNISNTVYYVLQTLGIAIAVIIGVVLGIQFMLGSVEQKAEVQKALVPYVIGCIVIAGAFVIWRLVLTALNGL